MEELKPCPFCGGEARIRVFRTFIERVHGMGNKFYVTCTGCYIDGPGHHFTESDAADAWNKKGMNIKSTIKIFTSAAGIKQNVLHRDSFTDTERLFGLSKSYHDRARLSMVSVTKNQRQHHRPK